MAKRPCAEPGCPILVDTTRCPEHTRARDTARGTRQWRGYDATHEALRETYARRIRAGETVHCTNPHCLLPGQPITLTHGADDALHLEHNTDRTHRGPGHALCNLSEAGRHPGGGA